MKRILIGCLLSGAACLDFDETGKTFRCTAGQAECPGPGDVGTLCGGLTCGAPPASECVDATTSRQFQTQAVCSAGVCTYASNLVTCPHGCTAGACNPNPCMVSSCTQLPTSMCTGPNALRTYAEAGFCDPSGTCNWAPVDIGCHYGCTGGNCTGGTCAGVSCMSPPPPTCVGTLAVRTYSSGGTCNNGACTYAHTDSSCTFGCAAGACRPDPCAGMACATPPAPVCVSATNLRTSNASGQCTAGQCQYATVDTVCPNGCDNGACLAGGSGGAGGNGGSGGTGGSGGAGGSGGSGGSGGGSGGGGGTNPVDAGTIPPSPGHTLQFGTSFGGWGRVAAVLADQSTLVAGELNGSQTFGAGPSLVTLSGCPENQCLYIAKFNATGALLWAKRSGGGKWSSVAAVAPYSDGSFVVAGGFSDTGVFGPGEAGQTTLYEPVPPSGGIYWGGMFLARFNANGTLAWAKRAGGTKQSIMNDAIAFDDGTIIATGYFDTSAVFGPGEANQTTLTGKQEGFLAKYASTGSLLWVNRLASTGNSHGEVLARTSPTTFVVGGGFNDNVKFDSGQTSGDPVLYTAKAADVGTFLAKYTTSGVLVWAKRASDSGYVHRGQLAGNQDDLYLTGSFERTVTFGPGQAKAVALSPTPGTNGGIDHDDIFVAKFSSTTGNLVWVRTAGGPSSMESGDGLTLLADGTVLVAGVYAGKASFGSPAQTLSSVGGRDVFLARYNGDGTLVGLRSGGGVNGTGIFDAQDIVGRLAFHPGTSGLGFVAMPVMFKSQATYFVGDVSPVTFTSTSTSHRGGLIVMKF